MIQTTTDPVGEDVGQQQCGRMRFFVEFVHIQSVIQSVSQSGLTDFLQVKTFKRIFLVLEAHSSGGSWVCGPKPGGVPLR